MNIRLSKITFSLTKISSGIGRKESPSVPASFHYFVRRRRTPVERNDPPATPRRINIFAAIYQTR